MICPLCKHPGPHTPGKTGHRCGNCGEPFAATPNAIPAADLAILVRQHKAMRHRNGMLSVRRAFLIMSSVAMLSFLAGLTWRFVKHGSAATVADIEKPAKEPYSPLKVPALRFLPKDYDILLAVQNEPLRKVPGMAERGDALAAALGIPESALAKLPASLRTDWDNILETVVALKVDTRIVPPQFWLVLHVKKPIDIDGLIKESNGRRVERGKRELIRFQTAFGVALVGWQPVDKYFILAFAEEDFDLLPERAEDEPQLPERLLKRVLARGTDDMLAWAVVDTTRLPLGPGPLAALLPKDTVALLKKSKGLTAGLRVDPEPKLSMWLEAVDEPTAHLWRETLLKESADLSGKVQVGGGGADCFVKVNYDAELLKLVRGRVGR